MPVVIDSRGVGIWLTEDEARDHAAHLLEELAHKLTEAEQWGTQLGDTDAETYHEAERLLTEVGDVEDVNLSSHPVNSDDTDVNSPSEVVNLADEEQRRRQERDRRIAEVYAMYQALGEQDDEVEPEQHKDTVGVRRDGEWWITYGRGPEYRVRDQATAEREAKRRVGWT
jgi:hypothetical protein